MDDINYKAYLYDEEQMIDVVEINTQHKVIRYYDCSGKNGAEQFELLRSGDPNADCPIGKCELFKSACFKDINGNEVFDRHILKWTKRQYTDCSRTEIESEETKEVVIHWDKTMWMLASKTRSYLLMSHLLETDDFEIVGHLYDHIGKDKSFSSIDC